jgi:hypothetical protein
MASGRIPCLTDRAFLIALVKKHIHEAPSKSSAKWIDGDHDQIASHYEDFLLAIAISGKRLDSKVFPAVMKQLWSCDQAVLNKYCKLIAGTLAHCRRKVPYMVDGSKLSRPVFRITTACAKCRPLSDSAAGAASEQMDEDSSESSGLECINPMLSAEAAAASKSLADMKKLFASSCSKTLARANSCESVQSSEAGSPRKAPAENEVPAKAPTEHEGRPAKAPTDHKEKVSYICIYKKNIHIHTHVWAYNMDRSYA